MNVQDLIDALEEKEGEWRDKEAEAGDDEEAAEAAMEQADRFRDAAWDVQAALEMLDE